MTHSWTEVEVHAFDVSSYTVTITVLDNGRKVTFSGSGLKTFKAAIDVDFWSDILLDYVVRVNVVDISGCAVSIDKKVTGIIGGILQFMEDIWNAIAGFVAAAVAAIAAAVNFIITLIVDAFKAVITGILAALSSLIQSVVDGFVRNVQKLVGQITSTDWSNPDVWLSLFMDVWVVVGRVAMVFAAVELAEVAISVILLVFGGIGGLIKSLASKVTVEGVKKALQKILLPIAIGAITETVSQLVDTTAIVDWIKGAFGKASGLVGGVLLGVIKACQKLGKANNAFSAKDAKASRYAIGAALAIMALMFASVKLLVEVEGPALIIMDTFAVIMAVASLLVLAKKSILGRIPGLSDELTGIADIFGDVTSTIEKLLAGLGAAGTFLQIGLHAKENKLHL